jgi:hypothetical protein
MLESIRQNAEIVRNMVEERTNVPVGFDLRALEWIDEYIDKVREPGALDEKTRTRLISMFGSFLGECCVRAYGGRWEVVDEEWIVVIGPQMTAHPLRRVWKRFDEGPEASLAAFFSFLGELKADPDRFKPQS